MVKEIHTKQYKTDPRVLEILWRIYERCWVNIGKDERVSRKPEGQGAFLRCG